MNFMDLALSEAKIAYDKGEVPVGAVIIKKGEIISLAHNITEEKGLSVAHAELVAIKRACEKLGNKYLDGCDMYVTLEPCAMCTGAIINSRIRDLYIGAMDPKSGCCGGKLDIITQKHFNHKVNVYYGINEDECSNLLKSFFKKLR